MKSIFPPNVWIADATSPGLDESGDRGRDVEGARRQQFRTLQLRIRRDDEVILFLPG